ncbi:SDR family NAD(P)-dependent oxidoreductase [Hutsoniella sourekii]|uniref:SDR family NAD(P)-dependent oxidoreductase n=1 Tax=Hutsoniella sourekii TaxID=87650 RepID=UPI002E1C9CE2
MQKIKIELGSVHILVNNAGGGNNAPLSEITNEAWLKTQNLDVNGVMYMTREIGSSMVEARYGRIINIASILGFGGLVELPIIDYATAKRAIVNFTRAAAAEWAQTGVTVNALAPGFFASEANNEEAMDFMREMIEIRTPMKRPGKPGELDSAIVFLAADESTYVTGQIIGIDGGWTAI